MCNDSLNRPQQTSRSGQNVFGHQFEPPAVIDQRSMMAHFNLPVAIKTLGYQTTPVTANDFK
jgi:hypothetical protein